jgi:Protein of unknown function (DUF3352)
MPRSVKRARLTIPVAAAVAAIAAAGCGSDEESTDDGAASIAPASTPVYVDAVLKPDGGAKEDAEAALSTILGTDDPGAVAIQEIEKQAAADGADFDYESDIEPWLGETFSVFLTTIGGDRSESEGAYVFETSDPDEALEFFSEADSLTGKTAEYEGVEYSFDDEGDVLGRIDDFIVGGDESAFKAAVDAADGDNLADTSEFEDGVGELSDDRLATLYVPPQQFLDALPEGELDAQSRDLLEESLGDAAQDPVLGEVTASASDVTLEFSAGGGDVETAASALLPELPGSSWLGVGFADVGAAVQRGIENVGESGAGIDAETIRQQLQSRVGIDLQTEVIDALGDAGLYIQGTTVNDIAGGLVIQSKDPSASAGLINKLQGLISQQTSPREARVQPLASAGGDQGFQVVDPSGELPQPIQVVQRDDKIVVGYGSQAVDQALAGGETLSANPAFGTAEEAVGDLGVDAFLSFAPVFQLAEAAGAGSDASFQAAKPYFDRLSFLASGSGTEDDRTVARVVIGLQE